MRVAGTYYSSRNARLARLQCGVTLLEAILLLTILSIIGVAVGVALQNVAKTPEQSDLTLAINTEAVSRMEQMKATPWASMYSEAAALTNSAPGVQIGN